MSIVRKRNTNITQLNSVISTSKDKYSITETWVGPYDQLRTKQIALITAATSTNLAPAEADTGILTITYETPPPASGGGNQIEPPIIEVDWVELRKKLEDHTRYSGLAPADIAKAKAWADDPTKPKPTGTAAELADKLAKGQTEYSMAVPVIRRTTYSPTSLNSGGAWFRSAPPAGAGSWQYLKTADRVSKQGTKYQRVEEWTGAKEWDPAIYP